MSPLSDARSPVELLADEFLARHKRGEKPTINEYCGRHPELADEIRDVFEAVLMVEDLKPGSGDVSGSFGTSVTVGGKRLAQVGDYRILCEIGRGGMGVVYEAEQQALGRRVALKVLPKTIAGDGSAQIRFQREAKAAARMHHTNIVPVFDVGQDGEHLYYAMQLIHGQGLDLVIHDLKRLRAQSMAGATANEKATDRSIAASLAAGRFEREDLAVPVPNDTAATAAYEGSAPSTAMLPGQSDITTATSDRASYFRSVAQIGVQTASALAYAHGRGIIHRDIKPGNLILDTTGNVWVTDFGLAKTGDAGVTHTGDILGTVRYMSPERFRGQCDVRADVYALGMTLYELLTLKAAYASGDRLKLIELIRQEEAPGPRSVDSRIPRDLETIVMKAIDKDPKRRYQSADEMGEDLQRFVNDEPIKARRIGPMERLARWVRRNPAVAYLTAAVFMLMAVGTAVSTWQAVVATRARAELAKKNNELADEQAKVQARFDTAVKAIETFHTGVSEDMLLKNPEFKELRTKLLKEAAGFYADLEKLLAGQTDAKSRKTLADGYFQLGELTEKIGDNKESLAVHQKALALRCELAAAAGADVETRLDVARSLRMVGRLLYYTGDTAGALRTWEEMRDLAAALEAESPTDAVRQQLARSHRGIGAILSDAEKRAEALQADQRALAIQQKLADANPADTQFQLDLAVSHNNIGLDLSRTGKSAEALQAHQQALGIQQKLADDNPADTQFQRDLAGSHNSIGIVLWRMGKPAEALREYQEALAIRQKLADANPAVTQFQSDLAGSHNSIGTVLQRMGNLAETLQSLRKARGIQQKLADDHHDVTEFQSALALSHYNIGGTLLLIGKPLEAMQEHQRGLAICKKLADAHPTIIRFQSDLARSHFSIGIALLYTEPAEAFQAFQKALAIRQKLADAHPTVTEFQINLAKSHDFIAWNFLMMGKPEQGVESCRKGMAIWEKLVVDPDPRFQSGLANSQTNLGWGLVRLKRLDEALSAIGKGLVISEKLANAEPNNDANKRALGESYFFRGLARAGAGQSAEAAADLRKALELRATESTPNLETQLTRARTLAMLAGLGGNAKSGVTKDESKTFADQSVAALAEAVKAGWALPSELKQPDFDALRGRADFQKLVAEVEAKVERVPETAPPAHEKN
jgi:serine/threonine-protein kinase